MTDNEFLQQMKAHMQRIRADLAGIENDRRELRAHVVRTEQNLTERLAAVRARCPHPDTKYHPDASGNNDSWTECRVCGATVQ